MFTSRDFGEGRSDELGPHRGAPPQCDCCCCCAQPLTLRGSRWAAVMASATTASDLWDQPIASAVSKGLQELIVDSLGSGARRGDAEPPGPRSAGNDRWTSRSRTRELQSRRWEHSGRVSLNS